MARVGREIKGPFVSGGNPDTANDAPVTSTTVGAAYDLSGQLGAIYRSNDGQREWVYVKFSSTSTGATPAQHQPLYWIANSTANMAAPNAWTVDNNTTANSGTSIGDLAGILRNACTRGNYVWAMRKSGTNFIPVISGTGTQGTVGDPVVGSTATSASATTISSTSTALGTVPAFIGRAKFGVIASTATGLAYVGSTTTAGVGVNVPTYLDVE